MQKETLIQYIVRPSRDTHPYTQLCNAKSDTCPDTRSPTCGGEVIHGIKSDHDISIVPPPVVMDPVLLQDPRV